MNKTACPGDGLRSMDNVQAERTIWIINALLYTSMVDMVVWNIVIIPGVQYTPYIYIA